MQIRAFEIASRRCEAYGEEAPQFLLIQPEGEREESPGKQAKTILSLSDARFLHISVRMTDWNRGLSPWTAAPVFGGEHFGDGAADTLMFIENDLLPFVRTAFDVGPDVPAVLGGYSLAAFFALWCAYQTDTFSAVAAASPSVWFPGWMEYAREHRPAAACFYLSLGDREEKTRNRTLATVGNCIKEQYRILEESGVRSTLEWNPGSHFAEPELRCAKGFVWCMSALRKRTDGDNGNNLSR